MKHPRSAFLSLLMLSWLSTYHGAGALAQDDSAAQRLENRLTAFIEGGYDPLTAPLSFYDGRKEGVTGAWKADPDPVPDADNPVASGVRALAIDWADKQDSLALMVMHKGALVLEHYGKGFGRSSIFNPQSMTKTVLALLVGKALDDGAIETVDDPLSKYLPELADDPKGDIPIKALLHMAGGVAQLTTSYDVTRDNPGVVQFFGEDFKGPTLGLGVARPPYTAFDYNNDETNLVGHVLTAATGKRFTDYLSETLWAPMGLSDANMYRDRPGGTVMMSCCLLSRPMDFLKLGQMVLEEGRYAGESLIPRSWIAEMVTPSATNPGYGYQIWLGNFTVSKERPADLPPTLPWQSEPFAAEDVIIFRGFGFQRVWIIPSLDLVILRAGNSWPKSWDESVLPILLIRALRP